MRKKMTLRDVIELIEGVAGSQPAVNMIVRDDVFKLNAYPSAKYGVFAWTQGVHNGSLSRDDRRYQFNLFYVDRIAEGMQCNAVAVQSIAIEVLENILRRLSEEGLGVEDWSVTTFRQRFADVCAGAYVSVVLDAPIDSVCGEEWTEVLRGDFDYDFNFDFFVRKTIKKEKI